MEKEIAIFKTDKETINVEVLFEDETVWLTQEQMAQLFEKSKSTINEHIKNIFAEGELEESTAVKKFGNSEFQQKAPFYYNLDVIISVGYWAYHQTIPRKRFCRHRHPCCNSKTCMVKRFTLLDSPHLSHFFKYFLAFFIF